jgi:hypothetical protein
MKRHRSAKWVCVRIDSTGSYQLVDRVVTPMDDHVQRVSLHVS